MRIKIEFEKGGELIADMDEKRTPKTCAILKEKLPFEYQFQHSSTSGEAIVAISQDLSVPKENQRTVAIKPGSICSWFRKKSIISQMKFTLQLVITLSLEDMRLITSNQSMSLEKSVRN